MQQTPQQIYQQTPIMQPQQTPQIYQQAINIPPINIPNAIPISLPAVQSLSLGPKTSTKKDGNSVNYRNFNPDNLLCSKPEKKESKNSDAKTGKKVNYTIVSLQYNYGTSTNPIIDKFYLEGPILFSSYGLVYNAAKSRYGITSSIKETDPDQLHFLKVLGIVYAKIATFVEMYKFDLGIPKFSINNPDATGLRELTFYPTDQTGRPIPDSSPLIYAPCFMYGKPPFVYKTKFYAPSMSDIDWKFLTNTELHYIPLYLFEDIYSPGNQGQIRTKLQSAIITGAKERTNVNMQEATLSDISGNKELSDRVTSELAKLIASRQSLITNKDNDVPKDEPVNTGPTYAGIKPTSEFTRPPQQGPSLPSIPGLHQQEIVDPNKHQITMMQNHMMNVPVREGAQMVRQFAPTNQPTQFFQ